MRYRRKSQSGFLNLSLFRKRSIKTLKFQTNQEEKIVWRPVVVNRVPSAHHEGLRSVRNGFNLRHFYTNVNTKAYTTDEEKTNPSGGPNRWPPTQIAK